MSVAEIIEINNFLGDRKYKFPSRRYLKKKALLGKGHEGRSVTALLVNEAQDLLVRQILLFRSVCEDIDGFSFCADTAQAIEMGRSFQFSSLKQTILNEVFSGSEQNSFKKFKPGTVDVHHLTLNFRSSKQIIELAATLVDPIVRMFPETTDAMPRERSTRPGSFFGWSQGDPN